MIGKLKCNKGVLHLDKRTIEISSIEIMAILGLLIWLITILLRHYYSINSVVPIFYFTTSFGGAWIATAMLKQLFSPVFGESKAFSNIEFSKKVLFCICVSVIFMSFINELLPCINTSTVFDLYDVLATILAEIIAFSIPVIRKEKVLIENR